MKSRPINEGDSVLWALEFVKCQARYIQKPTDMPFEKKRKKTKRRHFKNRCDIFSTLSINCSIIIKQDL